MDNLDLIPSAWQRFLKTLEANCGPRSEMTVLGSPNRLKT